MEAGTVVQFSTLSHALLGKFPFPDGKGRALGGKRTHWIFLRTAFCPAFYAGSLSSIMLGGLRWDRSGGSAYSWGIDGSGMCRRGKRSVPSVGTRVGIVTHLSVPQGAVERPAEAGAGMATSSQESCPDWIAGVPPCCLLAPGRGRRCRWAQGPRVPLWFCSASF